MTTSSLSESCFKIMMRCVCCNVAFVPRWDGKDFERMCSKCDSHEYDTTAPVVKEAGEVECVVEEV